MRLRKAVALTLTAMTALTMTACSQSDTPTTAPQPSPSSQSPEPSTSTTSGKADSATLTISGFAFSELSVKAGTEVTVTNEDSSDHTVTVKGTPTDVNVPAGGTAAFKAPDQPGSYDLSCDFHPAMSGTLTVTG